MLPYNTTELDANRRGEMTTTQQQRLQEQLLLGQRSVSNDITQFGFVLGVIIIVGYVTRIPTAITIPLLIVAVLAFGIFKYLETGLLRRLAADVESGRVGQIEGTVRLTARQRGSHATYRLEVPAWRYRTQIEARLYQALADGRTYRLYIAESSGTLLSMELWRDDRVS